ncbi:MAG: right-handed parallel beta-helix repeat-containing protein [Erythrobacter sp.]
MRPSPLLAVSALAAVCAAWPLFAQSSTSAPFRVAETGRAYRTLQAAVDAVGASRATIVIAPGTYRQCAVQEEGVITFLAEQPGSVTLAGTVCEDKAALVLRGRGAEVRGLSFTGMRVADFNGAGIRLEQGDLMVSDARFADSQQGILTANGVRARVTIMRSTFSGLGNCDDEDVGCAHAVYIGDYGALVVRESRFERGTGGHYLKSRTGEVVIENNSFDDSAGFETNYMIDLPAGARGRIAGNFFVQGRSKLNSSAFIALGTETILHPSDGLVVEHNEARFVPGLRRQSALLADWTGSRIVMQGNRLMDGIVQYQRR